MRRTLTPSEKKLEFARRNRETHDPLTFRKLDKLYPREFNIVSEGDSWFDYPREMAGFKNANIVDWVREFTSGKANFLRLEENGAESTSIAGDLEFGVFKGALSESLDIRFVLLSMGGNDLSGKDDIYKMLIQTPSADPDDLMSYVNQDVVRLKILEIKKSYITYLDYLSVDFPSISVVGHTYDYFVPDKDGIDLLFGLLHIEPWVSIGMKYVPAHLQLPLVKWLIDSFAEMLLELGATYENFTVVDCRGILIPGSNNDWANEIHPTSSGFKKIAQKIYDEMKVIEPLLP